MLIDNWRKAHKMLTVWVGLAAVSFGVLPLDQQAAILAMLHVPAERIPAVLGLVFLAARFTRQPSTKEA